ncbi:hypothetical protein M885DRAFT_571637 [Pelagophyceae sp. CCMP2097]|nr:hypothetical protein M885DRAFT_571637 [Pelagophyceae sp. CCMP2097]
MAAAFELVWATTTTHILCVYHTWKNFYSHIKPLCQPGGGFRKAGSLFWCLVKDSDVSATDTFDAEWDMLVKFVEAEVAGRTGVKTLKNALAWLNLLYKKRRLFAARWVVSHRTFLIYSTQRIEAVHSAIQQCKDSMLHLGAVIRTTGEGDLLMGEGDWLMSENDMEANVGDLEADDEAMFPTVAPLAAADVRKYCIKSAALYWVNVGDSYCSDGRQIH